MNEFVQLISTLLSSRTQTQIFHWQVEGPGSYATHIALGDYYEGIPTLVDGLVESFQGRYGIQRGYNSPVAFKEDGQAVNYFEALSKYVETIRVKVTQDSYIQNQIDEVITLIETTKYKLKNLQ